MLYAPFNKPPYAVLIHPYYLKQYNNRWYILGFSTEFKNISVFPLDRIQEVTPVKAEFIPDTIIENPDDYFYDVIGVTIPKEGKIEKLVLRFSEHRYPYIKAKPIHPTQQNNDVERTITLKLIPNKELTGSCVEHKLKIFVFCFDAAKLRGTCAVILQKFIILATLFQNRCNFFSQC